MTASMVIPDIGQMREHIVVCDGSIEPSPDLSLSVIQNRDPLLVTKAQVTQVRNSQQRDYRAVHDKKNDDYYITFRSPPEIAILVYDLVLWAERKVNFESDVWFRVNSLREHLGRHRYITLACQLITRYSPIIADRGRDKPTPIRGLGPLY